MTKEKFIEKSVDLLKIMMDLKYCETVIEFTFNMMIPIPKEQKPVILEKFIEIAKLGLPERDYHYEISQVFKEFMGY